MIRKPHLKKLDVTRVVRQKETNTKQVLHQEIMILHLVVKLANSNILKTARKESKLPKLPLSKPGSCLSVTIKGSTTSSQLRHSLIPKPTINV
nr:hypothetical protein [Tanacetum cinerariifolium]